MNRKNDKVSGVNENYHLLKFEYIFRQVGFVILLAIIVAALVGLFSQGVVSSVEKINATKSVRLDYERFGRRQTESRMQLTFLVKAAGKSTINLTTENSNAYEPGSVWPQPDSMYSRGRTLYIVYDALKTGDNITVWIFITPSRAGKWNNVIHVNNEPGIQFWQFIYP